MPHSSAEVRGTPCRARQSFYDRYELWTCCLAARDVAPAATNVPYNDAPSSPLMSAACLACGFTVPTCVQSVESLAVPPPCSPCAFAVRPLHMSVHVVMRVSMHRLRRRMATPAPLECRRSDPCRCVLLFLRVHKAGWATQMFCRCVVVVFYARAKQAGPHKVRFGASTFGPADDFCVAAAAQRPQGN